MAHKSQGKTLPTVIVDIQSCRGTVSVYVMLLRVTLIDHLRILRPFNIKKIQCCPSEDTQRETQRLSILQMKSWSHTATTSEPVSGSSIPDKPFWAAPERLEDLEELNTIQMAVSSLELPENPIPIDI